MAKSRGKETEVMERLRTEQERERDPGKMGHTTLVAQMVSKSKFGTRTKKGGHRDRGECRKHGEMKEEGE